MLNLIKNRLDRSMFDDVLEVAWSTMWNVTDETAINCKKFLEGQGMEYFLRCLKVWSLFIWPYLFLIYFYFKGFSGKGGTFEKYDGITGKCCRSKVVKTKPHDVRIYKSFFRFA